MSELGFKGAVFDLDGVITDSAHLHSKAWKVMFDEFLEGWTRDKGEPFQEFTEDDYLEFVDGKPRYQGVKSFLESRGVSLPFGEPSDSPEVQTYCGLGNRKNVSYQKQLEGDGAEVFETSVALVRELKARGCRVGVASSSKNTELVLKKAGLEDLFETRVCGVVSEELGLKGKPDPDIFIKAADNLGLKPHECLMVEDAISGVQAGKRGNFALVLGVARHLSGEELLAQGADVVLADLGEITIEDLSEWFKHGVEDDSWYLTYHGYRPEEETLREALTVVGNGYMGTRGSIESERDSENHYPGTYIAGLYNKLPTEVHGRDIYNNDFVNAPNWTLIEFAVGEGEYMSPLNMEVLSYRHRLDMKNAVMERRLVVRDKAGRLLRLCSRRIVSMKNRHLAGIQYSITPLNFSAPMKMRSAVDGNVINKGVARYRDLASKHLEGVDVGESPGGYFVHVRTNTSGVDVMMSAEEKLFREGEESDACLNLTAMRDQIPNLLANAEKDESSYSAFALDLLRYEHNTRQNRRLTRNIKRSKLPCNVKSLDEYDFSLRPNLEARVVKELLNCRWVSEHRNIICVGRPGLGKSHILDVLARAACLHGYTVRKVITAEMLEELHASHADGTFRRTFHKYEKLSVLYCDEFGYEPFDSQATK